MTVIKNNSFFKIEAFMVNDLHLKGNALLTYAIIHSFSKGEGWFTGGLPYLTEWLNITKQGLTPILKNLTEQGLVVVDRQIKGCASIDKYKTADSRERNFNVDEPSHVKETLTSRERNFNDHVKETLTSRERNFNDIYIDNNKNTYINNSCRRTDFCFDVFKSICANTYQIDNPQLKNTFLEVARQLQKEDYTSTADEIVFVWNSYQTELKDQGREDQYMPNALKWLTNDALTKVEQSRRGKYYSIQRACSAVNYLAKKQGIADE